MRPITHTRWLDAPDYVAVMVADEAQVTEAPFELDRRRVLGLLARASRRRRRDSHAPVSGVLAVIRA